MKNILYITLSLLAITSMVSCSNDDDTTTMSENNIDFSGTFMQEDQMGRAGINTVLSGSSGIKNDFNTTIPSQMTEAFQPLFLDRAVALHAAFNAEYETNILGLDAITLTTILATDVLQVAPNAPTTYYDGTNVLTGRNLTDDVIDVSLILLFGGQNGDRFNGQDTDNDGQPDLPVLVTDGVSNAGETPMADFPYLETPHN